MLDLAAAAPPSADGVLSWIDAALAAHVQGDLAFDDVTMLAVRSSDA